MTHPRFLSTSPPTSPTQRTPRPPPSTPATSARSTLAPRLTPLPSSSIPRARLDSAPALYRAEQLACCLDILSAASRALGYRRALYPRRCPTAA